MGSLAPAKTRRTAGRAGPANGDKSGGKRTTTGMGESATKRIACGDFSLSLPWLQLGERGSRGQSQAARSSHQAAEALTCCESAQPSYT